MTFIVQVSSVQSVPEAPSPARRPPSPCSPSYLSLVQLAKLHAPSHSSFIFHTIPIQTILTSSSNSTSIEVLKSHHLTHCHSSHRQASRSCSNNEIRVVRQYSPDHEDLTERLSHNFELRTTIQNTQTSILVWSSPPLTILSALALHTTKQPLKR